MRPSPQKAAAQQIQPGPLRQTYDAMRQMDLNVPATYEDFEKSFQENDQEVADLHAFFKEEKWDAPDDVKAFRDLMLSGVKKKELSGSNAGISSSPEPLGAVTQSNDVAAGAGEDVPAGTPMTAPADVMLPASGSAEQTVQPLGMMDPTQGGGGNFDNPLEQEALQAAATGQSDPFGQIQPGRTSGLGIQDYDKFLQASQQVDDENAGRRNYDLQQRLFADMVSGQRERDGAQANAGNEAMGLGGVADFGASFYNALVPGGAKALASAVEYLDNITAATGLQGAPEQALFMAGASGKTTGTETLRNFADNNTAYVSPAARKELSKDWTNGRAWSAALGSGSGSIASLALVGATTGGAGALGAGSAMALDEAGQAADAAGLTPTQKLAMQSVVAPVIGLLEEAGLGSIVKNPVARQLIGRSILAGAAGKLERAALVKAAAKFAPRLVEIGGQMLKQGAGEATTEGLQSLVSSAYKIAFDEARGNEGKTQGGGSFGTLENGLGAGLAEAGKSALADAAVGGILGGVMGGASARGQQATQPASVEAAPVDAPLQPEPTAVEAAPAQPAVTAVPTVRLKSGEVILADLDENGQAIRAYKESGEVMSLENPDVKARIEQAAAVSLQEQQPTTQADAVQPGTLALELSGQDPAGDVPPTDMGVSAPEPQAAILPDNAQQGTAAPLEPDPSVVDVTGQAEQLPASNDTSNSPSKPDDTSNLASNEQQAKTVTPQQQAQNNALDALDNYKQLDTRARKGKAGAEARKELGQLAKAAGLDFTVGNDFTASLTKGGKRVTRTNAITGTTPIAGHVPARQRTPEVRDAALTLAGRGEGISLIGLGVMVNGKRLSPRDVKAAAKDILEGRNTHRADELLNALEAAQKEGWAEISTGNGLSTQKMRIPFEDYVGNPAPETAKSAQPADLSDAEWDTLIAEDENVAQAVQDYGNPDGSLDLARLLEDAQGKGSPYLQFMFGINEDTADKLLALANERANQTPEAGTDPGSQAPSSPQPSGLDSGSAEPAQEVAPAAPYYFLNTTESAKDAPVFEEAVGAQPVKLPSLPKQQFFAYKKEGGKWQVFEVRTGLSLGGGATTLKKAVAAAEEAFSSQGKGINLDEVAKSQRVYYGASSPRVEQSTTTPPPAKSARTYTYRTPFRSVSNIPKDIGGIAITLTGNNELTTTQPLPLDKIKSFQLDPVTQAEELVGKDYMSGNYPVRFGKVGEMNSFTTIELERIHPTKGTVYQTDILNADDALNQIDSGDLTPVESTKEATATAPAKPTLRERNIAAKQRMADAVAAFRSAPKGSNNAYSAPFAPFSEQQAAAIVEMVKAAVELGIVNSKGVIRELRGLGWDENDATDAQLLPAVRQALKDEGVFKAKAKGPTEAPLTDAAKERKSMKRLKADPATPAALTAQVEASQLDQYEPRSLADAQQAALLEIQRGGLDAAVGKALSPPASMNGDVKTALRVEVLNALNAQMDAALTSGNEAEAQRRLDQAYAVAEALAKRGTEAGQEINAYKLLARHSPAAVVVAARKEVKAQRDKKLAQAARKGKATAARARNIQKEAVSATVKSDAVAKAKAALSGDPKATTQKEPTTYGAKNKFFTKDGLKKLRDQTKGMLFSAPVSPVVLYEGAYHLEAGVRKFTDWSVKMVRSYGAAIRPRLAEIYDLSKAEYVQQGGDPALVQSAADVEEAIATEQAEMLATRIQQLAADKKPAGQKDPVQQLLDTLTAKVRENLPAQPGKKVSPREAIIHALRNQAEYADVWERAKEQVSADIEANDKLSQSQKDTLIERLDTFFAETIGQAYATKQAATVVRTGLKELGAKLDDIVRRHATQQDATGQTLTAKLVAEAGLAQQEAAEYAAVVEKEFKRQVQVRRESILDRIHTKLGAVLPARKTKTALDRLFETLNLSPITDQRVTDILIDQLDLPTLTPQDVQALRQLAENVQAAPVGFQKDDAVSKLLAAQEKIKGVSLLDIGNSMWYANVLSNYKTHAINITANLLQSGAELGVSTVYALGTGQGRFSGAGAKGLVQGIRRGLLEAKSVLTTGREVSRDGSKYEIPGLLETIAFQGGKLNPASYLKYVTRTLRAGDVLFSSGLKEMRAYELATREALGTRPDGEPTQQTWERIYESLYNTEARLQAAEAQARTEGLTGMDFKRRVFELVEQSRPVKMQQDAREYATAAVFNGDVKGALGYVATTIQTLTSKLVISTPVGNIKPAVYIIPFTRVITNVSNAYLDYTPVGAARALKGASIAGAADSNLRREYSLEEQQKLIVKSAFGSAMLVALYALSHDKDDEDKPTLEITGAGTGDFEKDAQLKLNGWQPYSIRTKGSDKWVSYANFPFATMMVVAGNLADDEKYRGAKLTEENTIQRVFISAFRALQYTKDMTALKGAANFLAALDSKNPTNIGKFIATQSAASATGYLPFAALEAQLVKDYDAAQGNGKKQALTFSDKLIQNIPVARGLLGDAIDQFGDPVPQDTDRLFSAPPTRDPQTQALWDYLTDNGLFISVPPRTLSQTILDATRRTERNMTDEEYYRFMQERGKLIKQLLPVAIPLLKGRPAAEQQKFLNEKIVKTATEAAKFRALR